MGVALESRMEDTSLPAAAVRGKGTQGLLFPLRSLSLGRSLVFPQQTVGTMKAACSPPLAQKGCQYWTYQTLNGRISLPMKIKSMTCFPLALLLVKWVTAIISISKTEPREGVFSHVAEETLPQTRHPHIKCINSFAVSSA